MKDFKLIKKVFICLLLVALVCNPLFADNTVNTSESSGISDYLNFIVKAAQAIGIVLGSLAVIYCGIKIFANGGLTPENTKYIVAVVVGIVFIAVAIGFPTWIVKKQL